MLRAHYRETPKLQAGRSKRGNDNGRAGKEEGRRRRRNERGSTSLPRAPRSKDIPKIENFPKTQKFLNNTRGTVIKNIPRLFLHRTLSSDWQSMSFYGFLRNFSTPPPTQQAIDKENMRQVWLKNVQQESRVLFKRLSSYRLS